MATSNPSPVAQKSASAPPPESITVHARSRVLELAWADGTVHRIPFELMRVYSPSAEVRGHGPGQETLQQGKRDVDIVDLTPVGNYAIKPTFSDGHDSGLYSWDYLFAIGHNQEELWNNYLEALERAGGTRDPSKVPPPPPKGGCGHHH